MNDINDKVQLTFGELISTLFPPTEGEIDSYSGGLGQGKTYGALCDLINDLEHGHVVKANFRVKWDGFLQSESLFYLLLGVIGIKRNYFEFLPENFEFVDLLHMPVERAYDLLRKSVDCIWYIDEGHNIFDSYLATKLSIAVRNDILTTRHANRIIKIISQRTTAIHVTARANVNRFYVFEKIISWPFLLFRRSEYQKMKDEDVDEEVSPLSTKWYFGSKRFLDAYDSKHMRSDLGISDDLKFRVHRFGYFHILWKFVSLLCADVWFKLTYFFRVIIDVYKVARHKSYLLGVLISKYPDMLVDHRSVVLENKKGLRVFKYSRLFFLVIVFWLLIKLLLRVW